MTDLSAIPSVSFTEPDTIRLISTAYIKEPALGPLADSDADRAILEDLESRTSARQAGIMPLPPGLRRNELRTEADGFGWTYINAAFCYTRPTGNRFNGAERGAWYAAWGSYASETAQAEVIWHLTRELDAVGIYENITAYRELLSGFTSQMHDLTGLPEIPCLNSDPAIAYPAGQALARSLRQEANSNGILYPSARHPEGRCLVALRPSVIQNIRQGSTRTFAWTGDRVPEVT